MVQIEKIYFLTIFGKLCIAFIRIKLLTVGPLKLKSMTGTEHQTTGLRTGTLRKSLNRNLN